MTPHALSRRQCRHLDRGRRQRRRPREAGGAFAMVCVVVLALLTGAQSAAAQPPAPRRNKAATEAGASESQSPPGYDQAVALALKEFALGNYAEARGRFYEAHRLLPNARTYRALGMVEYELRNYGDAIEALTLALSSTARPLEGQARTEAEELLVRARGYVARVRIEVNPDVATVVLDGVAVDLAAGGTLMLQVGDHDLEFRAPGRLAEKRRLRINGGEEETLRVVLPPVTTTPEASRRSEGRPLLRNPWLWTAVGVVIAGAAAGTAIALTGDRTRTRSAEPYSGNAGAAVLRTP